jgi:hypothetical protein
MVIEELDGVPATLEGLPRASIVRLPGRDRTRTRIVSTLLHGNEQSGLRAVHALATRGTPPAVDILAFLGNPEAARLNVRSRPGARDLNRCFRPPYPGDLEGEVAREALERFAAARPEAIVDIHNNTGHNPAYSVGVGTEPARLALASLLAPRYVHTLLRLGAVMETFEELPVVTLECGRAGDPVADRYALDALVRYADAERLPAQPETPLQLLSDPTRVTLAPGATLAFAERAAGTELTLNADIDRHNWSLLPAGELIGWVAAGTPPLQAITSRGEDVTDRHFAVEAGRLITRRAIIPIMMTTDVAVAASDCLFYLVEVA